MSILLLCHNIFLSMRFSAKCIAALLGTFLYKFSTFLYWFSLFFSFVFLCYFSLFSHFFHVYFCVVSFLFVRKNSQIAPFSQIMLQSTTVSKICKNLSLFGYSSLAKSSFPWYSSTIKNFQNFPEYIFSKNSSFKKVVDPYIFPKQW